MYWATCPFVLYGNNLWIAALLANSAFKDFRPANKKLTSLLSLHAYASYEVLEIGAMN